MELFILKYNSGRNVFFFFFFFVFFSARGETKDSLDIYLQRSFSTAKKEGIRQFYRTYLNELTSINNIIGEDLKKVKYYYNRGNFLKNNALYRESNKNYDKLLHHFNLVLEKNRTDSLSAIILFTHNSLADNFFRLNEKEKSLNVYKRGLQFLNSEQAIFSPVYFNKNVMTASQLNNIGIFYSDRLQEYDIALSYFKKAFELVKNNSFSSIGGSIRDNMALVYLRTNKLKKAQLLFEQNNKFYEHKAHLDQSVYEPWLRSILQKNEVNLQFGNLKEVTKACNNLEYILDTINFSQKINIQLRYFKLLEKLNIAKNQYNEAFTLRKRVDQIKDSIAKIESTERDRLNRMYKNISLAYTKGYINSEQEKKQVLREKELFYYYLTIITVVLILIGVFIGISLYRKKIQVISKEKNVIQQKLEIESVEKELLDHKLEVLKKDVFNFELNDYQHEKWINNYLNLIKELKTTVGRARTKYLKEITIELNDKIVIEEKTYDHYQKIKDLEVGFFGKLYHYNPPLNKAEIKLCTMIRLGYNNLKIASLQYINLKTVHQNRYKLREKFGLRSDDDLNEFIKNI